jgi:hypothetical protein
MRARTMSCWRRKRVLGDELGARSGQIGDHATRNTRRPACPTERVHRPRCQPGCRCVELEPQDASHWCDRSESANDHQVLFCGESQAIVRRRREVASTGLLIRSGGPRRRVGPRAPNVSTDWSRA